MNTQYEELDELLELYGVQSSYEDVYHLRQEASVESLMAVLKCLGARVERLADVPGALQERRDELVSRCIEPIVVAWDGEATHTQLRLSADLTSGTVACILESEAGQSQFVYRLEELPLVRSNRERQLRYARCELQVPGGLAPGYHRLVLETPRGTCESLVISAPRVAYAPEGDGAGGWRAWGCFLPLYALWSTNGWGAGDYALLGELVQWTGRLGGRRVGTLPLLAAYLDEPFEPSPYAPASRLLWNELYIDVPRVSELRHCEAAQRLLGSTEFEQALTKLRRSDLVDYRELAFRKRQVLELLAADFFARRPPRFEPYRQFVDRNPHLQEYAKFRAAYEQRHTPWTAWPAAMRDGRLPEGDYRQSVANYHSYVQWIAAEQVESVAERGEKTGCGLYLDLPLGVRRDGYDVWRHQSLYAADATAGAPPDAVFTKGQDWGFPPLMPEANRLDGYAHLREVLVHHLSCAAQLRTDHIMGLHRLYWIPCGLAPHEGVYVQYRPEEAYAVLSLESHRHRCMIVGEDLGTVPPEVNESMAEHHVRRLFVVEYELDAEADASPPTPPRECVASLDTHDMPPFAGWWQEQDLPERRSLGLLDDRGAALESERRAGLKRSLATWLHTAGFGPEYRGEELEIVRELLRWLAASPAELVMVNLENLWGETRPQNSPGTSWERPNWRRKARYAFEDFAVLPDVISTLQQVQQLRQDGAARLFQWNSQRDTAQEGMSR